MGKKDLKPLHGARKNIKKVRKSLVTSGFFKKSGDIFFGATSHKNFWRDPEVLFLSPGYEPGGRKIDIYAKLPDVL